MRNLNQNIKRINSVKELHDYVGLPSPANPLMTIINHNQTQNQTDFKHDKMNLGLYNITIKKSFKGKLKYGKNHYDFDDGTMSFIAPYQIISLDNDDERNKDGWSLLFHPDLIRNYPLAKAIKNFGFFSYDVNEALHLSDEEDQTINAIIQNIQKELNARIDHFSQDVMVSNLELLLSYCNRFYSRQFITRKMANHDLLSRFENILDQYFKKETDLILPSVEKLAAQLYVSPAYLSDMLRSQTGQNTQQHIHDKLIEKAKEILTSTNLTVSQVAYQLGFDYPQSFSKLFKSKTSLTPIEFRNLFN